jgi:hypothetical protein
MASSATSTRCIVALAFMALVVSFGAAPASARPAHDPAQSSGLASGGLRRALKQDCQWKGVGRYQLLTEVVLHHIAAYLCCVHAACLAL